MKRSFRVSFIFGGAASTLQLGCKALEALHTVEFTSHISDTTVTRTFTALLSTRSGATVVAICFAVLLCLCWQLWRRRKQNTRSETVAKPRAVRTVIEEREEVHRTRITRRIIDE